jgi:hypothetical protein
MQDIIERAKTEFLHAKSRMSRALETTPDERLNWSPSPTARTPIQQVAHAAKAVKNMKETFDGNTFQAESTAEAEQRFREWEIQFSTREEVIDLLERNSAEYLAWLDTLTPDRLNSMVKLPFNLGEAPMMACLSFPPAHTHGHASQMEYIQTIYGDQDWHL